MIGRTISHYKITAKLGEGGMGVVYKAEDTKLERPVALKFLSAQLLEDEEARERFTREAKAAARVDHPNICTIHEIGEDNGQTFLAMAYVEGQTVREKIKARPLKLEDALDIAMQTAQGLQAAHEKEIVHRDIKSANLIVTPKGQVKIMDFGLAQLAEQSRLTKTAMILGTPAYMSPEQARREPTDRRTDIWSLGVVIYEMVTGKLPFEGERQEAVAYAIVHEEPEAMTAQRVDVPVELDRIVRKALAKDRAERYPHVEDLLVDLRALRNERESGKAQPMPSAGVLQAGRRKLWYAGGAALAVALILGTFVGSRFSAPVTPEPQTSLVATPLTSFVGSETGPTFSPNGEQVAFAWNGEEQDNFDIWVQTIAGGPPLRLTSHSADDFQPAWSPDGLLIAFVRGTQGGFGQVVGKASLFVIPSVGGPARAIGEVAGGSLSSKLTWTPESKALIVSDQTQAEGPRLFLLSIETGERRQLTESPEGEFEDLDPALSPDGRTLAFARRSSFWLSEIHTLPLSEDLVPMGEARRLTSLEQDSYSPGWTPDGSRILFTSSPAGGSRRIWSIPASGGERAEPVALPGEAADQPAISRQGNRLVYVQGRFRPDVQRLELTGAARGTKPPTRILASTRGESDVQFSPDGERIAFASRRSGPQGIFVADSDGSNVKPLYVKEGELAGSPRWSPDGQHLVFDSTLAGHVDVFVISAQGGLPLRVTKASSDDSLASWSRDGQWIYFSSDRSGRYEVWKISPTGGEPVQVTREGGGVPFESADGKHIYYVKDFELRRTSVWKVAVAGGEETQVLEPAFGWNIAVTEKGLYYIEPPDPGSADSAYAVRRFDFDSEQTTTVWQLPPGRRASSQLTVSPGERELLYTEFGDSGSDLRLVENFQ